MSRNELLAKVQELKEWEALQKEMEEIMSQLKDDIKKELEAQDTELLKVGIFTVRYQTITSNRFDTKEFKKKYGELYDMYKKPSISRRFTVA